MARAEKKTTIEFESSWEIMLSSHTDPHKLVVRGTEKSLLRDTILIRNSKHDEFIRVDRSVCIFAFLLSNKPAFSMMCQA